MKPLQVMALRAEALPDHPHFCHLRTLSPLVLYDLRYASARNFAGRSLYGDLDCAWLHREAAVGLQSAAAWLQAARPGWRILVLDALRPQRVQEAIWRDVVGTPAQDYFADPVRGSIHSYGMAVDATLIDPAGREADMGSGFDEMSPVSHPALHAQHLAQGLLTARQVAERGLLLQAMQHGGFNGIPNEWWHFDHGDRSRVRRELPRIT
ncbi:MAG: M15 family metallopeptidase [Rubrivivax sp.]|nr:M15 family metallopeptidase [Rubrivivax sp.]